MENKKVIGVVQCLQHLKDGMTRDDIAEHYGITKAECKILFQHEDLKGKKTIKKPSFIVVDDATAEVDVKGAEEVKEDAKETIEVVDDANKADDTETETEENNDVAVGPGNDDSNDSAEEEQEEEETEETVPATKATWGD